MTDSCQKCQALLSPTIRACPVCFTDADFPNVRATRRPEEVAALDARYAAALVSASARGVSAELKSFEASVLASEAVMNRSLGALHEWLNGRNPLFMSFHKQVEHLGRIPNDGDFDQQREAAESSINPYCYRELNYAALSLDRTGMTYYGAYSVTLKTVTIEDRSSIFERNPFYFNRTHHVIAGSSPPPGYRAPWTGRARLAAAKLQPYVQAGIESASFPAILMELRRNESDCDFVEVQIYGDVNRAAIAQIKGPAPTLRADKALWKQAKRKATELAAGVEEIG